MCVKVVKYWCKVNQPFSCIWLCSWKIAACGIVCPFCCKCFCLTNVPLTFQSRWIHLSLGRNKMRSTNCVAHEHEVVTGCDGVAGRTNLRTYCNPKYSAMFFKFKSLLLLIRHVCNTFYTPLFVRPSVCLSVCPSVRPSLGRCPDDNSNFFSGFKFFFYIYHLGQDLAWDWISASYLIKYAHTGRSCDLLIFGIPAVNFLVRAFQFGMKGVPRKIYDISPGFSLIFYICIFPKFFTCFLINPHRQSMSEW